MPAKVKGQPLKRRTSPKDANAVKAALNAPLVPIETVQKEAIALRAQHPQLDDDTVALCVLHISTRKSIRQIARDLKATWSWCYVKIARPEVQAFLQQLSVNALGVAAARSIQTLQELSERSGSEAMRYQAATELLDRAGLGNTTHARSNGLSQSYAFSFGAPPKDSTP